MEGFLLASSSLARWKKANDWVPRHCDGAEGHAVQVQPLWAEWAEWAGWAEWAESCCQEQEFALFRQVDQGLKMGWIHCPAKRYRVSE